MKNIPVHIIFPESLQIIYFKLFWVTFVNILC